MLLEMASVPISIARASWVRIKSRGRYNNDLALVEDVDKTLRSAGVLLVPRIPLDRKRDRKRRAKPALFDAEAIKVHYGANALERRNRCWVFKGKMYQDGLLSVEFELHQLLDGIIKPSQDELDLFRQTTNEWVVEAANSTIVPLNVADRIQVVAGPHRGIWGYLMDVRDDSTAIFESHTVPSPLQVLVREVWKLFQLGNLVQVVYREHRDVEGFIVEMDQVFATIYIPKTAKYVDTWHQQAGDEVFFFSFRDMVRDDNFVIFYTGQGQCKLY
jgi:hypothetical protein